MDRNQISKIPSDLLLNLELLEEINLAHNELVDVPEKLFSRNFHLKSVDFSSNKIKFVSKKLFESLTELEVVKFRGNQIESLDAVFRDCRKLKRVDFSYNRISKVSGEIFHQNASLDECRYYQECGFEGNPCTEENNVSYNLSNCTENWNRVSSLLENGEFKIIRRKFLFKTRLCR